MLFVQLDKLDILVTNQDLADVPPATEGGEEGTRDVSKRRQVPPPYEEADGSNQQLHNYGRPSEEGCIHGGSVIPAGHGHAGERRAARKTGMGTSDVPGVI